MTEPVIVSAPDRLRDHYASGFAVFFALAKPAFDGMEAAIALNMQSARVALTENEAAFKGALQIGNPVELFTQQLNASQQAAAKAMTYGRKLFDIAALTHSEWVQVAQAQSERQGQCVKAFTERLSQNAPEGAAPFIAAMNSSFAAFGQAAESVRGLTQQAIEAAQGRLDAVADATHGTTQAAPAGN
jgi:phasin family protein